MTGQLNLNALETLTPRFCDWNSNVPAMRLGRSATGLCICACTLSQLFALIKISLLHLVNSNFVEALATHHQL